MAAKTQEIILASGNVGKIREIQAILNQHVIVPQSQFNLAEVEETGLTFIENALIKARHATTLCQRPAIADDSGLVVDALEGAPGVISARYAGEQASDAENLAKVLQQLGNTPMTKRSARFICVIAFLKYPDDPCPIIAQGVWEGQILFEPKGENGFGYDPIFWVPEKNCSSAELNSAIKNSLSHRGQALQQFQQQLKHSSA